MAFGFTQQERAVLLRDSVAVLGLQMTIEKAARLYAPAEAVEKLLAVRVGLEILFRPETIKERIKSPWNGQTRSMKALLEEGEIDLALGMVESATRGSIYVPPRALAAADRARGERRFRPHGRDFV